MTHPKSAFTPKKDTLKNKLKRLLLTLAFYAPLMGIIYGGGWYMNKQMPEWVSHYFNVEPAEKMAVMTKKRVKIAEQAMSFPIGVSAYVSAQIDNVTATTKASTLAFAARMTTALMRGVVYLIFILLGVYVIFKFLKAYKTKATEDRIAINVVNMLLPVLEEMNNNIKKHNQSTQ